MKLNHFQPKKNKGLALKIAKNIDDSSDEESMDDEELAMLARRMRKFFKPKNGNFRNQNNKTGEKFKYDSKGVNQGRADLGKKDKTTNGVKCHECGGIGHIRADCGNLKRSKGKAANTTQSDESDRDNTEETFEDMVNYLALTTSHNSSSDADDYVTAELKDFSDDEGEDSLQDAYNDLFKEFFKLQKSNKRTLKNLEELVLEKEKLLEDLTGSNAVCNTLKSENALLIVKNKALEKELCESKTHLTKFSSDKLDKMLNEQKSFSDKTGLGFDKYAASSSNISSSKIMFVKPNLSAVTSEEESSKIGKNVPLINNVKAELKMPSRKQSKPKFIPTCHHCGKVGHIRPNCFKMKPCEYKNDSSYSMNNYEGLCNMMRVVLTRLDELDNCHKSAPSVKKVWVRKVNTIHPLRGSGSGLT
jgi:hypothetical protein